MYDIIKIRNKMNEEEEISRKWCSRVVNRQERERIERERLLSKEREISNLVKMILAFLMIFINFNRATHC